MFRVKKQISKCFLVAQNFFQGFWQTGMLRRPLLATNIFVSGYFSWVEIGIRARFNNHPMIIIIYLITIIQESEPVIIYLIS